MVYLQTTITLKNGAPCVLRTPRAHDAAAILEHMRLTSAETDHMARYADEITMTQEQESAYLEEIAQDNRAVMICAEVNGMIAANAGLHPVSALERTLHRAEFGVSVKQAYWGLGIGGALLSAVIDAARTAGYRQLELDVVASNARAIALYEKLGFVRYGTRENSYRYRDGHTEALHLMLRRL